MNQNIFNYLLNEKDYLFNKKDYLLNKKLFVKEARFGIQLKPMLLRDFFSTCAKRIVAADCEKSLAARALLRRHKLLPPQISRLKELTSLMRPAEGFPFARAMKRKIICHLGPTNSGKTYAAIEALKASGRGVYCAPLRLLAQEMFDKLNAAGTACSLRTGEITKLPSVGDHLDWNDAPVVSCTVEMLNLKRVYKVAVIDEIQLLADPQRGWAFSQALLGCNAERVYLCGEAAAKPLIEKIIADCGEEVEFVNFERLTPLTLLDGPLPPNFAYQTGDCIVSFSRKNIFRLRSEIERKTKKRVAVVYGALPAENRALQAAQFNDEQSGVDILVASDAIGMGLNL